MIDNNEVKEQMKKYVLNPLLVGNSNYSSQVLGFSCVPSYWRKCGDLVQWVRQVAPPLHIGHPHPKISMELNSTRLFICAILIQTQCVQSWVLWQVFNFQWLSMWLCSNVSLNIDLINKLHIHLPLGNWIKFVAGIFTVDSKATLYDHHFILDKAFHVCSSLT